jgi:hypothetical protein
MVTAFDRYMARGPKPTRRRSPRVEKHWGLLVQMQKLIEDANLSPNKAAVMVAKDNWRNVSKTEHACVQWLKDNQRKFRGELRRPSTLLERLKERNAWLNRENPNWREELHEQQLREIREARERRLKWARDHSKEAAERAEQRRRAADKAARKVERWHEWFREDPKAALAELLDEIKRDEESFDD